MEAFRYGITRRRRPLMGRDRRHGADPGLSVPLPRALAGTGENLVPATISPRRTRSTRACSMCGITSFNVPGTRSFASITLLPYSCDQGSSRKSPWCPPPRVRRVSLSTRWPVSRRRYTYRNTVQAYVLQQHLHLARWICSSVSCRGGKTPCRSRRSTCRMPRGQANTIHACGMFDRQRAKS